MRSMTRSKVAHYLAESIWESTETRGCSTGVAAAGLQRGFRFGGRLSLVWTARDRRVTLMNGPRKLNLNDNNKLIYTTLGRRSAKCGWLKRQG